MSSTGPDKTTERNIKMLEQQAQRLKEEIRRQEAEIRTLSSQKTPLYQVVNRAEALAFMEPDSINQQEEEEINRRAQEASEQIKILDTLLKQVQGSQQNNKYQLEKTERQVDRIKFEYEKTQIEGNIVGRLKEDTGVGFVNDAKRYGKGTLVTEPMALSVAEKFADALHNAFNIDAKVKTSKESGNTRVFVNTNAIVESYAKHERLGGHAMPIENHFQHLKDRNESQKENRANLGKSKL